MTHHDDNPQIPRRDWTDHSPKPVPDHTGAYRPEKTVDYLHNLHLRYGSRN